MASIDTTKQRGPLKGSTFDSGGAVRRPVPVRGVVKSIVDPYRSGRIYVYLLDNSGVDTNDPKNWTVVRPIIPFYGYTTNSSGTSENDYGNFSTNSISYGMWWSPPDVGSEVICVFADGKVDFGYYIGVVPKVGTIRMVPGIAAAGSDVVPNAIEAESYGGAERLPVTNPNDNNPNYSKGADTLFAASPIHSYAAQTYFTQGTIRDLERGAITSSGERESPSRVGWGVATPGRPLYRGNFTDQQIAEYSKNPPDNLNPADFKITGRKGGHTIVMDDGDINAADQLIRIRTSGGHQIMMRDDEGKQFISIMHSSGHYIELGSQGTIDIYSDNSVNISTDGDLNLHAEQDVNINAGRNINMATTSGKIVMNASEDFELHTSAAAKMYSNDNFTVKCDASIALSASGEAGLSAGGGAFLSGDKVNLNSGSSSLSPEAPEILNKTAHFSAEFDEKRGWLSVPGKIKSIVSRLPAHFPWPGAGFGVNKK